VSLSFFAHGFPHGCVTGADLLTVQRGSTMILDSEPTCLCRGEPEVVSLLPASSARSLPQHRSASLPQAPVRGRLHPSR